MGMRRCHTHTHSDIPYRIDQNVDHHYTKVDPPNPFMFVFSSSRIYRARISPHHIYTDIRWKVIQHMHSMSASMSW